jgi:hypothetical protein
MRGCKDVKMQGLMRCYYGLCGAVDARIDALGVVCVDSIGGSSMRAINAMG